MLMSQANAVPGTATITHVRDAMSTAVRNRGAEIAWQKDNVLIARLELFGSVTYVDAASPAIRPSSAPTVDRGRQARAQRAEWRTTLGATYRPAIRWALTVAGRYQSKIFATLDNTDTVPNVYQAIRSVLRRRHARPIQGRPARRRLPSASTTSTTKNITCFIRSRSGPMCCRAG